MRINPKQTWLDRRSKISSGLFAALVLSKTLFYFGFAMFFAASLREWAVWFVAVGMPLDFYGKWKWLDKFPSGSWSKIWIDNREQLSYGRLCQIIGGKILVVFGLGIALAPWLISYVWWIIGASLLLGTIAVIRYYAD